DVLIGKGLLADIGKLTAAVKKTCRAAILSDDRVFPLYGKTVKNSLEAAGFSTCEYIFPNGEASKTLDTFGNILEFLAGEHLTRTDLIVALGGGVVGDVAGFCAACFLRGIDFVQIPTSLLAAVDSSVGGKTAVDLKSGKNLAGAFHQPILVVCDTDTFQTLDDRQLSCGMAEVIKYGVMCDRPFFEALEQGSLPIEDLVERCVSIKRDVVQRDEFDNGERKFLNLGHTLGHAVEKHSNFSLTHGAAVAVGMMMIARISEQRGYAKEPLTARLDAVLRRYGLPTSYAISANELFGIARGDKKTEGSSITLVIPERFGECTLQKLPLADFEPLCALCAAK
ncbi:MAG: 3-dehydroquinate synthase, partial [Eubacteriales bacterium]